MHPRKSAISLENIQLDFTYLSYTGHPKKPGNCKLVKNERKIERKNKKSGSHRIHSWYWISFSLSVFQWQIYNKILIRFQQIPFKWKHFVFSSLRVKIWKFVSKFEIILINLILKFAWNLLNISYYMCIGIFVFINDDFEILQKHFFHSWTQVLFYIRFLLKCHWLLWRPRLIFHHIYQ